MNFRALISQILSRERLANIAGHTFGGKRNLYKALGYQRELFPQDYRSRYKRNEIANRIVKALPNATWRGGVELVEDDDPRTETVFEKAFDDLNKRLNIWNVLARADTLAGIGRYAIIVIGAPGEMNLPLESCSADDIAYLMPYAEEDAQIFKFDIDSKSPRFGHPEMYNITRSTALSPQSMNSNVLAKQVHWTRVLHIADGLLDDNIYGEPRLECIWNRLDDLEKVAGGGAEAFWRRADGGTQFDLDPTIEFEDEDDPKQSGMKKEIEAYEHGLKKNILTRGVTVNRLGSDVADFASPVNSIISLISAGTGIPQRVLMGSEQAKLAAKMDRSNWDDRVSDRRDNLAAPMFVRQMIDRFIKLGALPEPEQYDVKWSQLQVLDDKQRADIALQWAQMNQAQFASNGEIVVTIDEIRDQVLDLDEFAGDQPAPVAKSKMARKFLVLSAPRRRYYTQLILAQRKEKSDSWKAIHAAADRFRRADDGDDHAGFCEGR